MILWCGVVCVCVCVCEAPTVKCQVRRVSMQWWWLQAGAVQMYAALYIHVWRTQVSALASCFDSCSFFSGCAVFLLSVATPCSRWWPLHW